MCRRRKAAAVDFHGDHEVQSKSGIDLSLLRERLSLTPTERWERNFQALRAVEAFREADNRRTWLMASETPSAKTEYARIVCTSGVVGGKPRIDGHRIRVRDVVAARDFGAHTPEEIAATVYPSLTLARVDAALAYYEDHRQQIERLQQAETRSAEEWLKRHPQLARDLRPDES